MKTKMILVAAPSGAGKSSFLDRIIKEVPQLEDVITYTTRNMRINETQGNPYHFLTHEEFDSKINSGFFVEWAKVHSNFYGTSLNSLQDAWLRNKVVIMDLDIQGVDTFKNKFPEIIKTIFILPPSIEELRRRVTLRDAGLTKDLDLRMKNAEIEMKRATEYDFRVINDDFETSYLKFKKIVDELLRLK